jgi:hypothetical protein
MMSVLSTIVGFVMSLFQALIEVPIIWIGEIVLFLITFGRHKPRWDVYLYTGGGDFAFLSELSFWIGIVAVCGIGGAIKLLFFELTF